MATVCGVLASASGIFAQGTPTGAGQAAAQVALAERARTVDFAKLPLAFEANLGQDRSNARFFTDGPGYRVRLMPGKASLLLRGGAALDLTFAGASAAAAISAQEGSQIRHSYFPSGDRKSWKSNVPTWNRVTYSGLYPGVDVTFYGNEGRLEYDFIVQPHADAASIQIGMAGAEGKRVDAGGNLALSVGGTSVTLLKPVAYQIAADGVSRLAVTAEYRIARNGRVNFAIGPHDRSKALVIDPVLLYGLDIPGTPGYSYPPYYYYDTTITAMTADKAGNTYVAASVGNSYASTSLMKFDPTGKLLLSVSLGSENSSIDPRAIAVDAAGDMYLAGYAALGLPVTSNALQATSNSSANYLGFLSVVKSDGSELTYSSYFGGTSTTNIYALAVDSQNAAYVTGDASGEGFPTTAGAYQPSSANISAGGFVAKINPALSGSASLVYSTFVAATQGSNQYGSYGSGIAVDASGNAYVAQISSGNYPVTKGAYAFDGSSTNGAYVTKVNPTGTALVYSAYLGPGTPTAIALDSYTDVYVVGSVQGTNFPVTTGAYQTSYAGGFASKLSPDGGALLYSTYLSGPSGYNGSNVIPTSVAIEPGCYEACPAFIAGYTSATDFPLIDPIQSFPGGYTGTPYSNEPIFATGFMVELSGTGASALFSTYLGGATSTTNYEGSLPAVALDSTAHIYFASNIDGADAPVTEPSTIFPGQGYLAKIGLTTAGTSVVSPTQIVFTPQQPVNSTTTAGGAVELRNVGSAAITLKRPFSLSLKDFTETDNCPATLPAGGICTVNVAFSPTAVGARVGTLSIASNAGNSPSTVALSGTGVNSPYLVVSTTSVTFGEQVVRTASSAQTVTVTNTGNLPQPIASVFAETQAGLPSPDYQLTSNCPAQLAAGASCQIGVVFFPSQAGLLDEYLVIQIEGIGVNPYGYTPYGYELSLTGVGVIAKAGTGTMILSPTALNLGSAVVGTVGTAQSVLLTNSGDAPVTVTSIGTAATAGHGGAGDFPLRLPSAYPYENSICGVSYNASTGAYVGYVTPFTIAPQTFCVISVDFQPSIAGQESGTLTITDTAASGTQTLALGGVGLQTTQPLAITPATMTFAAQPVGDPSAAQTFTVSNPGEDFVAIDRTYTTGDFGIVDGGNCGGKTLGPLDSCGVNVVFTPAATGSRTGTLVITDALSGTPMTFSLMGTGITSTGALVLGQSSLTFPAQVEGTTSTGSEVYLSNPGNQPFTINNITATGQFAVVPNTLDANYDSTCVGTLAPESTCSIEVVFSPTQSSGTATGTLEIYSTVGNVTVALSGAATSAAQAVNFSPSTIAFGPLLKGSSSNKSNQIVVYLDNTGGAPVTFPSLPTIAGVSPAPSGDFALTDQTCSQYLPFYSTSTPTPMPPAASCYFAVSFNPSLTATEQATLTLTDSAGTQTISLSGVGVATMPAAQLKPAVLAFDQIAVGSTSNIYNYQQEIYLYNNSAATIDISSVTVTAGSSDFSVSNVFQSCAGAAVSAGNSCDTVFVFHPTATGYRTGTAVFKDSMGNSYTATLAGYSDAEVDAASLYPQVLVLPAASVQSPVTYNQNNTVTIANSGNAPFTIGTVTGTNIGTTGDFPPTYNGYTGCNGSVVQPGQNCSLMVGFSPQATGARTGSLTFPITYADNKTASFKATLSGTGLAVAAAATLSPQTDVFPSTVAGTASTNYQYEQIFTVTNTGTVTVTLGNWSGTDITGTPGTGGDFVDYTQSCGNTQLAPGASCNVVLYFVPLTAGPKSGSISVPFSYGSQTKNLTAVLSGTGIAQAPLLQLSPAALVFNVEVAGTSDVTNTQTVMAANPGNANVNLTSITVSPNFTISQNQCQTSIYEGSSCGLTVAFTPLATTPAGVVKGTLTVVDNAPGSPHVVQLSGTVVTVAEELGLSQTSVNFGNQTVGSGTAPELVYLTNLGSAGPLPEGTSTSVQINSIKLSGTNAGDFAMTQDCGGTLGFTINGRSNCQIGVAFAPTATGTRTATVTITPATGSALTIQLIGVGTAATPAKLTPPKRKPPTIRPQ